MNPLFHTEFSISDSLKNVRKSVLIYETIIENGAKVSKIKCFQFAQQTLISYVVIALIALFVVTFLVHLAFPDIEWLWNRM